MNIDTTTAIYNVYCDESCHLEHDRQPITALGAIWCPKDEAPRLSSEVKEFGEYITRRLVLAAWDRLESGELRCPPSRQRRFLRGRNEKPRIRHLLESRERSGPGTVLAF